ncbi:MAG: PilT/PilU family type 4a pilus ATPase [Planctomycetota bacterium]|nr:PilT/PilU family type 4a pilus ATPase [Planctomycetota bacterium]
MLDDVFNHFRVTVKEQASDLILRTGHCPVARVEGHIRFLTEEVFTEEQAEALLNHILSPDEVAQFKVIRERDTAFVLPGVGRFRCNILRQRRRTAFVFRHVKETVPSMEELYLPAGPIQNLSMLHRGLVLVTGTTGSGKSTTLAAMIDYMNKRCAKNIITIEDPIEFVFQDRKCAVMQREIGLDTPDYHTALKSVVRQTPDVILVGEMRDLETITAALMAAETGHLVLSTLHTVNAVQTVERIISFFPPHQHETIRLQLALVLEGVVSQRLITRRAQAGRVPAVEIMLGTPTIKEMVLEGRTRELHAALEEGHQYYGSQSFNQSLVSLVRDNVIDFDDAMANADNPDELKLALRGITKGVSNIDTVYDFG